MTVAPDALAQLLFVDRFEVVAVAATLKTRAVEAVADVSGEQFVGPLAGEDDGVMPWRFVASESAIEQVL